MLVRRYMTQNPVTVTPDDHLDVAQSKMEKGRFRSLPVLQDGSIVGIITVSDILKAFLEVMGVSEEGSARIDLLAEREGLDLAGASQTIAAEGGEILGLGTYRERWGESPIYYVRLKAADPDRIAAVLKEKGYAVLGLHL